VSPQGSNARVTSRGAAISVPRFGVGLQFNPELIGWFPFLGQPLDVLEILFDGVMAPLDGPGLISPRFVNVMRDVAAEFPITGHSNYGGDFGFDDLVSTSAVRRHVPLSKKFNVPWVSNHCFYSDASWCNVWSSRCSFLAPRSFASPQGHVPSRISTEFR